MTEEQFKKRSFKHSMPYNFVCLRTKNIVNCLLIAVNFDGGTIRLAPFKDNYYKLFEESEEFWCSYEYAELPINKLKIT